MPDLLSDRAIVATQTLAIQELAKQATSSASQIQELASAISQTVQDLAKQLATQSEQLTTVLSRLAALESKS